MNTNTFKNTITRAIHEKQLKLGMLLVVALLLVAMVGSASAATQGYRLGADALVTVEDGSLQVWGLQADGTWETALSVDTADLSETASDEDTPVARNGDLAVYKLDSGEWQVVNGPNANGDVYAVTLTADFEYASRESWNIFDADEDEDSDDSAYVAPAMDSGSLELAASNDAEQEDCDEVVYADEACD